ncbi:MAG: pyridoxamine 5'-phosphate oxidase family protein [Candidatus Aminicenantes bacterium]|nr:pyridoxamine 5'-phosphate oxidase family protein [Candidatus Aminicenantes bacterium]
MPSAELSHKKCLRLLKSSVYGRLALCGSDQQPYITPVIYVLFENKIYIHTGFQGRKIDCLRSNPKICFEISSAGKLYAGPRAKDFSIRYWCVLVFGQAQELSDHSFKLNVMNLFMEKYAAGYNYEALDLNDMQDVNVIEVTMEKISGKVGFDPK